MDFARQVTLQFDDGDSAKQVWDHIYKVRVLSATMAVEANSSLIQLEQPPLDIRGHVPEVLATAETFSFDQSNVFRRFEPAVLLAAWEPTAGLTVVKSEADAASTRVSPVSRFHVIVSLRFHLGHRLLRAKQSRVLTVERPFQPPGVSSS